MNKHLTCLALTAASTLVLTACGGGGGDGDNTVAVDFTGTWAGYYDAFGTVSTPQSVDISGATITSVMTDPSLTGTITPMQGNAYKVTFFSAGVEMDTGGFLVDDASRHAGFLMSNGDFGLLEKGGSTSTTWSQSDSQGTWSGYTVALDYLGNITTYGVSTATVDAGGNVTGTGPFGDFTASLTNFNTTDGTYTGTWSNPSKQLSGAIKVWLSPDKTYAASYACIGDNNSPSLGLDGCTYNSWTKQ